MTHHKTDRQMKECILESPLLITKYTKKYEKQHRKSFMTPDLCSHSIEVLYGIDVTNRYYAALL